MTEQLPIEEHSGASTLINSLWSRDDYGDVPEHWLNAVNVLHGGTMLADNWRVQADLRFLREIAQERYAMAKAVQS